MSNPIKRLIEGYPVSVDIVVAWGDMDALQHVNHTAYLRYFESARIQYFDLAGIRDFRNEHGVGPILGEVYCRYRIPVIYPDTVSVGVRVAEILEDRFKMETVIVSHKHEAVAAHGSGTIVSYDYNAQRKAPLPQAMRLNILELEGKAQ